MPRATRSATTSPATAQASKTSKTSKKTTPSKTTPSKTTAKTTPSKTTAKTTPSKSTAKTTSSKATPKTTPKAKAKPKAKATPKAKGKAKPKATATPTAKATTESTATTKSTALESGAGVSEASRSDGFIEAQRALLLAERDAYVRSASSLRAEAEQLAEDREPGDVQFDEESGEGDSMNVERERDLILSAQAMASIEDIDQALARMDLGTYGVCARCGEPIPEERLRALPHASLCVRCKSGGLGRR